MTDHSSDLARSRELDRRLHDLVPGGAHTYAKGTDQFPEGFAPIMSHGSGSRAWDVDGNEYIEYGIGLRSVTLGHAHPAVVESVRRELSRGTNFGRPSALELEAAEAFLRITGTPEMVKFTKDGSTAGTAAVRLARAYTGRRRVAICVDQPFFSYDDWAMVVRQMRAGIPAEFDELTLTFGYNDLESVERLLAAHPGEIACFVLELERAEPPRDDFLQRLEKLVRDDGALLVADETITGFRWGNGGAEAVHGIVPDLSVWGKGLASGFALSALAGKRELMERGGLRHGHERVFLLSTTHGAEHVGLAAALGTIGVYEREPVIERMATAGEHLRTEITDAAARRGIGEHFAVVGHPSCLLYTTCDETGSPSQSFRTLFLQETLRRGLLAPSFVVSYAHSDADLERTVEIVDAALAVYAAALENGVSRFLEGRPVKPVDRRVN